MNSIGSSLVILLLFIIILNYIYPVLENVVEIIEYSSLSEKELSQEVLLESKDFYEELSTNDLINFYSFKKNKLSPFIDLLDSLDKLIDINYINIEKVKTLDNYINSLFDKNIKEEKNNKYLEILIYIHERYKGIKLGEITSNNEKVIYSRNRIIELTIALSNILHNIQSKIKDNELQIEINQYLVSKLNRIRNNNLLDTIPYFSLPPEYAMKKEKEIFDFLEQNPKNPIALIALANLYVEMRNYSDADFIYRRFIESDNLKYSEDIEISKRLIKIKIKDYYHNNIEADLIHTKISIDNSFLTSITEEYLLYGSEKENKVIFLLPYPQNNLEILEIKTDKDSLINNFSIKDTWKASSLLTINWDPKITKIYLKYKTDRFTKYQDDYGKYIYRYGGVAMSRRRFVCEINFPTSFNILSYDNEPEQSDIKGDSLIYYKWVNPVLTSKISVLETTDSKIGVSGEILNKNLINQRYIYYLSLIVLFFLITNILKKNFRNIYVNNLSYLILSSLIVYFLFNDLKYLEYWQNLTGDIIDDDTFKFISLLISIAFAFLSDRTYRDKKQNLKLVKTFFDLTLITYLIRLFFLKGFEFSNSHTYYMVIIGLISFIIIILGRLSRELNINKTSLFIYLSIAFLAVSFVSKNIGFYKLSKNIMDIIGYIYGGFISLFLITSLVLDEYRMSNKIVIGFWEKSIVSLKITIGNNVKDLIKVFLCLLMVSTFYFQSIIVIFLFLLCIITIISFIYKNDEEIRSSKLLEIIRNKVRKETIDLPLPNIIPFNENNEQKHYPSTITDDKPDMTISKADKAKILSYLQEGKYDEVFAFLNNYCTNNHVYLNLRGQFIHQGNKDVDFNSRVKTFIDSLETD
jgi:hypothetical protein